MIEPRYLVWLKNVCGPEAQIWHGDQTNASAQFPHHGDIISMRPLQVTEFEMTIDALANRYPCASENEQ